MHILHSDKGAYGSSVCDSTWDWSRVALDRVSVKRAGCLVFTSLYSDDEYERPSIHGLGVNSGVNSVTEALGAL